MANRKKKRQRRPSGPATTAPKTSVEDPAEAKQAPSRGGANMARRERKEQARAAREAERKRAARHAAFRRAAVFSVVGLAAVGRAVLAAAGRFTHATCRRRRKPPPARRTAARSSRHWATRRQANTCHRARRSPTTSDRPRPVSTIRKWWPPSDPGDPHRAARRAGLGALPGARRHHRLLPGLGRCGAPRRRGVGGGRGRHGATEHVDGALPRACPTARRSPSPHGTRSSRCPGSVTAAQATNDRERVRRCVRVHEQRSREPNASGEC